MSFLRLQGISKSFGTRCVLENVHLSLNEGEFVSIVGASASGKSTLLKIASGLVKPDSGGVFIAGAPVTEFPRNASVVFQNYSLLPWLTALENVRLAVESAFPDWTVSKGREHAEKYLAMVGLGAALLKRPGQLSGGMRQRVAIARAFAVEPRILFLDEPFGALDALTRATLQQELTRLCQLQEPPATVLMITNSVDEAVLLSDRVMALGRGPRATLSPSVSVGLPRPRAVDMMHDDEAVRMRARVTEFLIEGAGVSARRRVTGRPLEAVLPAEVEA